MRWIQAARELIWPSVCAACSQLTPEDRPFCWECEPSLQPIDNPCPRCGWPMVAGERGTPCLGCAQSRPCWATARAPYVYGGELAVAIRRWKLGGEPERTRALAQLLAPLVEELPASVAALVPVPLHPRRLRMRRFNQASRLARTAGRMADRRVGEWLDRVRDTPSQSTLDGGARRANVRGAFRANRCLDGRHVVLVDDVLTTGATAAACVDALRDAGAVRVDVLTLARALP